MKDMSKRKIVEYSDLKEILNEEIIKDLDLTDFDFEAHDVDFSSKHLENIDFGIPTREQFKILNAKIEEILKNEIFQDLDLPFFNFEKWQEDSFSKEFKNGGFEVSIKEQLKTLQSKLREILDQGIFADIQLAEFGFQKYQCKKQLKNVKFSSAVLFNCNFVEVGIDSCSFKKAVIDTCGFRDAKITICDFRYANVKDSTFQGTRFCFVDFYRASFNGITIFQDAAIENCSLNYISFETYCITKDNLRNSDKKYRLLQENKKSFDNFWNKWTRIDPMGNDWSKQKEFSLSYSYREAGRIYRQFSALWESVGLNNDADWAYVKAKKMERKHLWRERRGYTESRWFRKTRALLDFLLLDLCLGYGVSFWKVLWTFAVLIIFFGVLYQLQDNIMFTESLWLSIRTMFGDQSDAIKQLTAKAFSFLQTGLGMFLIGFMGFVLANKVRKS